MKKRFFVLFFAFLLLIPCLVPAASATEPEDPNAAVVSGDLQTVRYRGLTYVRFDARYTHWWDGSIQPSQIICDSPDVVSVELTFNPNAMIMTAEIYYKDGSRLTAHYISPGYVAEHQALMDKGHTAVVDFGYPSNNTVSLIPGALMSQPVTLSISSGDDHQSFDIYSESRDGSFIILKGLLVAHKDHFYYIDYEASGIFFPSGIYNSKQLNGMAAYAITDPALLLELEAAYDRYNSLSFGVFSGSVMDMAGIVLLVLTFGVFPLAVLVVFLILALRAKTRAYKKIFTAIYISAAAELALFATLAILFSVLR